MGNPAEPGNPPKETSGDVPTVDAHPKATASSGVPLPPPIPGAVELATERALAAVAAEVAAEAEAEAVPSVSVAELEVKIQLATPLIRRLEVSLKAVEALHKQLHAPAQRTAQQRTFVLQQGADSCADFYSAAAELHALHGKMGDMVSPTQAESTDVAAVLARADADAHRARVMAAKLEVYEGAFLHDAPDHRRRPHHRRRRRPGPAGAPGPLQASCSRELRPGPRRSSRLR